MITAYLPCQYGYLQKALKGDLGVLTVAAGMEPDTLVLQYLTGECFTYKDR
jgi:hypothetical protein